MDGIQRHFDAYLINQEGNSDKMNMGCVSYQYPYSRGKYYFRVIDTYMKDICVSVTDGIRKNSILRGSL